MNTDKHGFEMQVKVSGATEKEAWDNLLSVVCAAVKSKQEENGNWPISISTNDGSASVHPCPSVSIRG